MKHETSYGQDLCRRFIIENLDARFIENFRPPWLFGMELDFYFPDNNLAIEFNGDQHYFSTDLAPDPSSQIKRDWSKWRICKKRGVKLVAITAIDLIECSFRKRMKKYVNLHNKRRSYPGCLDHQATSYRKILKEKYGSPTAHRKGKEPRKRAIEALKNK